MTRSSSCCQVLNGRGALEFFRNVILSFVACDFSPVTSYFQVLEYYLHCALSYLARLEDARTKMYTFLLSHRNHAITAFRAVLDAVFDFLRPTHKDAPIVLDVKLGVECSQVSLTATHFLALALPVYTQ